MDTDIDKLNLGELLQLYFDLLTPSELAALRERALQIPELLALVNGNV